MVIVNTIISQLSIDTMEAMAQIIVILALMIRQEDKKDVIKIVVLPIIDRPLTGGLLQE